MTEDDYAPHAEWYAALVAAWRGPTDQALRDLLGPIPGGAAVDIGTGVGNALSASPPAGASYCHCNRR